MVDKDPLKSYMIRFEKGLRIRDPETRRSILDTVRNRLEAQHRRSNSLEEIIREHGTPEKLARELSNPGNWVVDMGSPLSPEIDIDPVLSKKASYTLIIIFISALILCISLLFTAGIGLTIVGVLVCFIGIWGAGISLLTSFMGYLRTFDKLRDSPMNIEPMGRVKFRNQLLIIAFLGTTVSWLLGSMPAILSSSGIEYTLLLSTSTTVSLLMITSYLIRQGYRILPSGA